MERRITTQDISWFLDIFKNKQLDLTPPYQRRSVWTRKDKLFYLDTIFKGYPCPAIFLHKDLDPDTGITTYHVVDGKQRLETILDFAQNKLSMPKDHHDGELLGNKFKDLSTDYKKKFWNYVISVDQLDIIEESVVDEVFDRLNRNSRKLERQELRHAKYDGWFINYAEDQSTEAEWKKLNVATQTRAKRMKDVQFLSELIIVAIEDSCKGFSQDEIDVYTAYFDLPEEDKPDFIVADFEVKFKTIRDFLLAVENINGCVSEFAKNFMHFYSLWCVAVEVHERFTPEVFAVKYSEFMNQYKNIKLKGNDSGDTEEKETDESIHFIYASNSVGANTEYPQRKARHDSLIKAF